MFNSQGHMGKSHEHCQLFEFGVFGLVSNYALFIFIHIKVKK